MFAFQTSRSNARNLSSEFPIGDPFGGPAYGEKTDVGSVVAAVAPAVVGGLFGSSAADAQAQAAQQAAASSAAASASATQLQRDIFNQQQANQAPWLAAGQNALAQMTQGMQGPNAAYMRPFSMADYQADPGYAFRLSEGMKALENSAAARGGLLSGNMLRGAQQYGQDLASNEYQNAFNRYQTSQGNQFNRLASMAGLGQTANTALGQAGQNYASSAGNIGMSNAANQANAALMAGQARASSMQGLGQAIGGINFGGIGNSIGGLFGGGGGGGYTSNMGGVNTSLQGFYTPVV